MTKKQLDQVLNFTQIQALCLPPSNLHLPQRHDKLLETVLLMGYLGLRVSEAINFTWQQIPVEDKSAFLVNGKGNKQRLVFNLLSNAYISKKAKSDNAGQVALTKQKARETEKKKILEHWQQIGLSLGKIIDQA